MADGLRSRSDGSNGAAYDPSYRAPVYDYAPKHATDDKCAPYYPSDDNPAADHDPAYDPTAHYYTASDHYPTTVNTTPYQSTRWVP